MPKILYSWLHPDIYDKAPYKQNAFANFGLLTESACIFEPHPILHSSLISLFLHQSNSKEVIRFFFSNWLINTFVADL